MANQYETWLNEVRAALDSINMPMDDWQKASRFDFAREYEAGTPATATAEKANRFWWREQNRALQQDCRKTRGCWLPRAHQGDCQPES